MINIYTKSPDKLRENDKFEVKIEKSYFGIPMSVIFGIGLALMSRVPVQIQFFLLLLFCSYQVFTQQKFVIISFELPLLLIASLGVLSYLLSAGTQTNSNLVRDFIYVMRTILYIYIGNIVVRHYQSDAFRFSARTLIAYSATQVIWLYLNIFLHAGSVFKSFSFLSLRDYMLEADDVWVWGFILLLFWTVYYSQYLYSRRSDFVLKLLFASMLILSFSRTNIIFFILSLIFLSVFRGNQSLRISKIIHLILGLTVVGFILVMLLRTSFFQVLVNKFGHTLSEISLRNNWNDYTNIVQNWRGYEMFTASRQWNSFGIMKKMFGAGFGTLIPVQYSELVGIPETNGGIIVLHNGYYMLLVKTGIFGVLSYLGFYFQILVRGLQIRDKNRLLSGMLALFGVMFVIGSWTTTGVIKSSFSAGGLVSLGMFLKVSGYFLVKGGVES